MDNTGELTGKRQLWGDAVVEHPSGVNASVYTAIQSDLYSSAYFLSFLVFFFLAYKYISRSIGPVLGCCFRFSQTVKNHDNLSLEQGRMILFLFSLFHFSMVGFFFIQTFEVDLFRITNWGIIPLLFLAFTLYYGFKYAALASIGWVIKHSNELTIIAKGFRDYTILAAVLTFPLYFATLFFWTSAVNLLSIWCISALLLCYLLFLFRTLQYFIRLRFSVFFYILYLCSLEIAPLALLYSVFLTT